MLSSDRAMDFVKRRALVRVYSTAIGAENHVMAEGHVIAYCPAPTVMLQTADGTRVSMSADLRVEEVSADLLRAELASARQELDRWRKTGRDVIAQSGWIVARDGGRHCERCEAEIRRGEAYQLEPGTGGLATHVSCPDLPERTTT